MAQQTLAQMVRAKYPGAYDDLSDQQLEASVKAKFPGQYDDLPTSSNTQTVDSKATSKSGSSRTSGLATLGDFVMGGAKGIGESILNLGSMVHSIPGVTGAVDALYGQQGLSDAAFAEGRQNMQATNTAQSVGKGVERIAEVMMPAGAINRAAQGAAALVRGVAPAAKYLPTAANMAVQGAAGAVQSATQGGNATAGGILSAGVPLVGKAVAAIPGVLKGQASKQVMQALGPTKERFKADAERLTPEILKRGLTGSRESLKEQSGEMAFKLGKDVSAKLAEHGDEYVFTQPLKESLQAGKAKFSIAGPDGPIVVNKRGLKQVEELEQIVDDLGEVATVNQIVGLRRAWDEIVDGAGGYSQRAKGGIGVPLKDQSEASVKAIGTKAIRDILNADVPDLAAVNKEFAFWKKLDGVLTQTLKRTEPQQQGLGRRVAEGVGAAIGGTAGAGSGPLGIGVGAILGASFTKKLDQVITSPKWRLVSAKMKNELADSMMSGKPERVAGILSRISAIQASRLGGQ